MEPALLCHRRNAPLTRPFRSAGPRNTLRPVFLTQPRRNSRFSGSIAILLSWTKTNVTVEKRRATFVAAAASAPSGAPHPPLDLTEDNITRVLADARVELAQLFDDSVGITGEVELAELDGPFVKISLKGRFWHMRSTVLARVGNYLKQRIPEILEVDIEDEKQLDDSPENF